MERHNLFLMFILSIIIILSSGCNVETTGLASTPNSQNELMSSYTKSTVVSSDIEKIEVIHFHATQQCYSCIMVGDYANEAIEKNFKNELETGLVEFKHINGQLPENSDIVTRYGATGSSLWFGVYTKDGSFTAEENVNVWYRLSNKKGYIEYVTEILTKKLSGDFS